MFWKKKKTVIIDEKQISVRLDKLEKDIQILLNMMNVNTTLEQKKKTETMTNEQMMKEWQYGEERVAKK